MHLSVVICTWNRAESLLKAIESIEGCRVPEGTDWEILLVDNNSTDSTAAVCQRFQQKNPDRYRYVLEKRQGKSFALNSAIENARGNVIAFTDDDVIVDTSWLFELLSALDRNDSAGVAGKIVPVWKFAKPRWLTVEGPYRLMSAIVEYDLGDGDQICQFENPPYGANLALRRGVFAKYGKFRTDLGPGAGVVFRGEDTEYCRRLIGQGEKILYVPQAVVFHPVPEERTKKRYFESWYFDYGRMLVRMSSPPASSRSYFGVPRYMFRKLVTSLWRWNYALEQKRRFYHRLAFWQTLGEMVEARKAFRKRLESSKDAEN